MHGPNTKWPILHDRHEEITSQHHCTAHAPYQYTCNSEHTQPRLEHTEFVQLLMSKCR